jgi:hypothetical protein
MSAFVNKRKHRSEARGHPRDSRPHQPGARRATSAILGFPWLWLAFLGFCAPKKPTKAKVRRRKAKVRLGV